MTDLEITKACAEAAGVEFHPAYNPLENDAQAMALVKKFKLIISSYWSCQQSANGMMVPGSFQHWVVDSPIRITLRYPWNSGTDLNRAICICVAKMGKP